ncbi:hypothetical protein [Streptomyces sp. ODS28]|uniref:hypothetical protein n=1 Tax=Streptomyces sp. ODS28 TaxID=3136688 RepID=UPI0031E5CBAB
MARLRILYTDCRPGLVLTDTPRPNCWACGGEGGHWRDYGDPETGEYAGTEWDPCPCWDDTRVRTLLPLPRIRLPWRKHNSGGYSDEPPF